MTELDFYFRSCLRRIIINSNMYEELIKSYDLMNPDKSVGKNLKALVEAGLASPQETGVYYGDITSGRLTETLTLQSVELEGLIVLVFLGEEKVIPSLLARLKEDKTKNIKRQIIAQMALRYLTNQDIDIYQSLDAALAQWEKWWEQNHPNLNKE